MQLCYAASLVLLVGCLGIPQVRFHDDKTTYTGTHARGGPESVPKA